MKNQDANHAKKNKIGKAWVVQWCVFGDSATARLEKISPCGGIVRIFSSRKNFHFIVEYTKEIYAVCTLSLSEKLSLAHYTRGEKHRKDYFSPIVHTFYQADWYHKMAKKFADQNNKSIPARWQSEFAKHPQYVTVGHNPYLEARKVFNLEEREDKKGKPILTWHELLSDGTLKKVVHKLQS